MSQLYVGNIDSNTTIQDLLRELEPFGEIRSVKIPQTPSTRNYAFVEFRNRSDALIAIQSWNAKFNWRVDFSRHSKGVPGTMISSSSNSSSIVTNNGDFPLFVRDYPSAQSKLSNFGCSGTGVYLPNNSNAGGSFGNFPRDCASANEKEFFLYDANIRNKGTEQSQGIKMKNRIRLKKRVASTPKRRPVRPPPPPWLELPRDITEKILLKLGPIGILWAAQYVCTTWRKICRDPTMWRVINMWKLGDVHCTYLLGHMGVEDVFTLAVDLSQGQAMEINMDYFGCDYYLEYIAERCGNLRCLRLALCEGVTSGRGLSKAIKRFPLLEELHLQCVPVQKRFIEAIGQSCPLLKTFALNRGRGYKDGVLRRSDDALAIAKSMPELHHLQLFGNRLTNEVLDAILNNCPKLESLDLRQCFNLDMEGELGKRCAQQIKIVLRPHDPTHNYEWLAECATWEKCYHLDHELYYHEDYNNLDFDDEDDFLEDDSDDYEDDDLSDVYDSDGVSDEPGFGE